MESLPSRHWQPNLNLAVPSPNRVSTARPSSPRLYTARYANKTLAEHPAAKVRITLGHPRFRLSYQLADTILELAPTWSMFGKSEGEFTDLYTKLLERRGGVDRIAERFAEVTRTAGVNQLVLLCFEDLHTQDLFCHRRVFAAWWEARTGQVVEELPEGLEQLEL